VPNDEAWLNTDVKHAARAAFLELINAHPDADYCGYALYSDASAMTVCCAVNTRSHLTRLQAEDPAEAEYYQWSPAEWSMEGVAAEQFAPISRRLRAEDRPDEEFTTFRDGVYEACVAALESLIAAGTFGSTADHVVVFSVSDPDDLDPALETQWMRRLNPPDQADRFARWRDSPPVQP